MYLNKYFRFLSNYHDFFQKIQKKANKLKKTLIKVSLYNHWRHPMVISYVATKWGLKHFFYFIFNGVFLFLLFHGTKSELISLRVFSYGAGLYFISRIVKSIWGAFIRFLFLLKKVRYDDDESTDWQRYKKVELKKRGIIEDV